MKRIILALTLLAGCGAPPDAVETVTAPLTLNLQTLDIHRVVMGIPSVRDGLNASNPPIPMIVTRYDSGPSNGICNWLPYGNTAGWVTTNVFIALSNFGDAFESAGASNDTTLWCLESGTWHKYYFSPSSLATSGNGSIHVSGGYARDWLSCNSAGIGTPIVCDGGEGDDHLETRVSWGSVTLNGDSGLDSLFSTSSNPGQVHLNGGTGNDCLISGPAVAWQNVDCGSGSDAAGPFLGAGCENLATSCTP